MTEGPGIAAMAYLSEQMPDFGNAFGPPSLQKTPKNAGLEGVDAIVLRSGKSMRRTHRSTLRRPRPSLRAISPTELPRSKSALISSNSCCRRAWRSRRIKRV